MHRTVAAVLLATLALGLAGCGSSERTETVGRAQLVRRLVSACQAGERAGRTQLGQRHEPMAFMLARQASLQTTMDRLDHLEATGSAKAPFDEYKHLVRLRLAALARVASANSADQPRVLRAELPAINAASSRAHRLVLAIDGRLRLICF
ncbi:MAG: hypothetical protein ACTHOE_03550 [Conexibacter sp.]